MLIGDGWSIEDNLSGLKIEAIAGKYQNHLHIEIKGKNDSAIGNRDFYFNPDGSFDGTGSAIGC